MNHFKGITATFIDEISHDIPHQNWGPKEWDLDFQAMKSMGIDTVVLIRSGYKKILTYPSKYLIQEYGCHRPPVNLVDLFLQLSALYEMDFYFGLYDSGYYWETGDFSKEIQTNRYVIDEINEQYANHPNFKGWYISTEISRKTKGAIEAIFQLGKQCKEANSDTKILISPWMDGIKAVDAHQSIITKNEGITLKQHESEWDEIFSGIHSMVDVVAFQDGHVEIHELADFMRVNQALARKYQMEHWTNTETFDRDMPIKFLPIKFEKLMHKINIANQVGVEKILTFEFSHFMSPNSSYLSAKHLFNRYLEYYEN